MPAISAAQHLMIDFVAEIRYVKIMRDFVISFLSGDILYCFSFYDSFISFMPPML